MSDELTYRLAELSDQGCVRKAFQAMLEELAPLGHDILPTEKNVHLFWNRVFGPAISVNLHGIELALAGIECIGATFFAPEITHFNAPLGRVMNYGVWVDSKWRRQGIAWRLQSLAHGRLKELNYTSVWSTVLKGNEAGLASCLSAGSEIVGYLTRVTLED